MTENKKAENN